MTSARTSGDGADTPYEHQPPWGQAPSDSLQYELFFQDLFISIRALKFPSCQFISAWMFDGAVVDLFATYAPLKTTRQDRPGLHARNEFVAYALNPGGGQIVVEPTVNDGFTVVLEETVSTIWHVPLGDMVIHQPLLNITLTRGGHALNGTGYAKRYTFEKDTQHTYWRFISGPTGPAQTPAWLWTAEAAFDLKKYDYFKMAKANGSITAAEQPGSWHRDRAAHGVLNGAAHDVEIEDLGRIERVIAGPGTNMKLSQAYCRMSVTTGGETQQSFALNEIACGSGS